MLASLAASAQKGVLREVIDELFETEPGHMVRNDMEMEVYSQIVAKLKATGWLVRKGETNIVRTLQEGDRFIP